MKILVFVNYVPYLKSTTSEFRLHYMIQKFSENHTVKILCVNSEFVEEYKEKYNIDVECIKGHIDIRKNQIDLFFFKKQMFNNVFYRVNQKDVDKVYNAFNPDVILVNNLGFFDYVRKYEAKIILNSSDVKYMEFARNAALMPAFLRRSYIKLTRHIRRTERKEFEQSDLIFFGSIKDMSNVNSQLQLLTPSFYLPVFCEKFEKNELCEKHSVCFVINNDTDKKKFNDYLKNVHFKMFSKYSDYHAYVICRENRKNNIEGITFSQELSDDILRNTRLFILNNINRNNYSFYICKAAAFGVPILASAKATDVFAVKDNTKYTISLSNVKDANILSTVEKIFDDNAYLERFRSKAYDFMVEHYNKEVFDNILENAIEKIEKMIKK